VLLAAGGLASGVIAAWLGICEDTVRKWRRRYCEQGLDGLADAPRPGRPRKYRARVVAEVKALACELPAAYGRPLARWTCPELARAAAAAGVVEAVSPSTVRRWLADDALKPWQHRSWISPRDPFFALKGSRVLDLYQRTWETEPLGEDEYVIQRGREARRPGPDAHPPAAAARAPAPRCAS
jgi:transposase